MNPLHNGPHSRLEELNAERDDAFRSRLRAVLVESGHAGPLDADVLLHDLRLVCQQRDLLTLELESLRKRAAALLRLTPARAAREGRDEALERLEWLRNRSVTAERDFESGLWVIWEWRGNYNDREVHVLAQAETWDEAIDVARGNEQCAKA